MTPPTLHDVEAAARRLDGVVRRTPLLSDPRLDAAAGGRVFVKAECLQRFGSFKIRGAYNAIAALAPDVRVRGVAAMSSGNHAIAVAAAARLLGAPAVIVMPADAPAAKREDAADQGAEIVLYDRLTENREAIARGIAAARGIALIAPFDDPHVIAGQGTTGLEIGEDLAGLGVTPDVAFVCASGGGLAAGVSIALRARFPAIAVYAVEPEGHDDIAHSLAAGERVENAPGVRSIADALLVDKMGALPFAIAQTGWAGATAVSDAEIRAAMRAAFRWLRLVVEPGGAAALAAALAHRPALAGRTAVVIASGGNVDASVFAAALNEAP